LYFEGDAMRPLSKLFIVFLGGALLTAHPARSLHAGILSLLEHGAITAGKDGGRAAEKAAGKSVGIAGATFAKRAEAIATLGLVGAGAVYAEREGDQLLTHFLKGRPGPALDLSDAQWKEKLINAVKTSEGGGAGPNQLILDLQTARALERDFADVEKRIAIQVADEGHGLYKLKILPQVGAALEIRPGLVLPLTDAPLQATARRFLEGSVDRGGLQIVTSMARDDADSIRRLGQIAGDKLKSIDELKGPGGNLLLPGERGSLSVLIGHVEGDGFAIRRPDGTLAETLSFDTIEKTAKEKETSVVFVGCDTYMCSKTSGTTRVVRDTEVSQSLQNVLTAETNASLIAAFGSAESPFVITNASIAAVSDSFNARINRLAVGAATVRGGAVTIRIAGILERASKFDFVPWLSAFGFAAFLAFLLDNLDQNSLGNSYKKVFPSLPNPLLQPTAYRALAIARKCIFYCLAPLVAAAFFLLVILSAFNFSKSAWRTRDEILEGLWGMLIIPHRFLLGLCILLSNLLWVGVPVLLVSSVLGIFLFPAGFVGVLIELLGLAIAAYFIFVNRAEIISWLDSVLLKVSVAIAGRRSEFWLTFTFITVKTSPIIVVLIIVALDVV
jgi:hypothetical protein